MSGATRPNRSVEGAPKGKLPDQLLPGPQTPAPTPAPARTASSTENVSVKDDVDTAIPSQATPVAQDQTAIPIIGSTLDNGQGDFVPIAETTTPNINEAATPHMIPHGPELDPRDETGEPHHPVDHSKDYQFCHVLSPPQTSAYATFPGFSAASVSSASQGVETPTARWLGLLIGDAILSNGALPDVDLEHNGLRMFGNFVAQTPGSITAEEHRTPILVDPQLIASTTSNASLQERLPQLGSDQISEKQAWHSAEPIKLSPQECRLFKHFVQHISQWIDLFEPKKPFGSFVPHLAMHNFGLINAILALSARHLALSTNEPPGNPNFSRPDPNDAIRYYYKALHYSQEAMRYNTYKVSLELLAISIIISTYEMLDGSSTDWERHLKGVFWIQRSQVIHGDSGGLRQGVWWAWLCQDIWAAFREKRKPFTFWRPTRSFDVLDPCELAARSVYLFAQVVSFCSREEMEEESGDFASKVSKADALIDKWDDWREHLTVEFEALPVSTDAKDAFPPIWVHPPAFGKLCLYHD
ncbi:hypothetical protein QQX98_007136 [Neonectria punicea]|uniref:Transcription factor domain-containing protein n=1 Tax=Neonectria punicea TaxID=979145 RepID=A0ABR1GYP8_9HYPO